MPKSAPAALEAFLDDPARPEGTFLFTVVSAPELVPPSDWLPIIFAEEDAGYASLAARGASDRR